MTRRIDRLNGRLVAAGLCAVLTVVTWWAQRHRLVDADHTDIVLLWAGAIAAALVATWPARWRPRLAAWCAHNRRDIAIGSAIAVVALLARLVNLESLPWALNGDEGLFATRARSTTTGEIRDPFGTGIHGHPTLYFYLQGAVMRVAGETVFAARFVSAILGAATAPALYALMRRRFGRLEAVAGATLLATQHVDVFFSRSALNNIAAALGTVVCLHLLDLGLHGRSRFACLVAGMAIGMAQYGYVGARILPIVAVVVMMQAAVVALRARRSPVAVAQALRPVVVGAARVVVGAVVVLAPLLAHYAREPIQFNGRSEQVSIFADGRLEQLREATGSSTAEVLAGQVLDAALLPVSTQPTEHYRGDPPFMGTGMALAFVLGAVVLLRRPVDRRHVDLLLAYLLVAGAVATTITLNAANRFVPAVPIVCVAAGLGIVRTCRWLARRSFLPTGSVPALSGAFVAVLALTSLVTAFADDNQIDRYSDHNTQVAEHLARDVLAIDPEATVYFAAAPIMGWTTHANVQYRAPDVIGIDLPDGESLPPIELGATTIFAALPERAAELDVFRERFPGGVGLRRVGEIGELYEAYVVGRGAPAAAALAPPR